MSRALLLSVILHIAVGLITWLEFAWSTPEPIVQYGAVEVTLAASVVTPKPVPKPQLVPVPKPQLVPVPKPKPVPKSKPVPVPKPKPVPVLKPKSVPKPKPESKSAEVVQSPVLLPPQHIVEQTPQQPEQDTEDLTSLLKILSEEPIESEATPKTTQIAEADSSKEDDLLGQLAQNAPESPPTTAIQGLAMDDFNALRAQLAQCWNIPSGAVAAEDLRIEIQVNIRPDGSVLRASLLDEGTQTSNPYYKIAAESALRALRQPLCSTLNLPLEKFTLWQEMILVFDPKEMF